MKRIKVTKYVCSYCGKEYATEEKCMECENSHEKAKKILPYEESDYSGKARFPKVIRIETVNGIKALYRFDKVIAEEVLKKKITIEAEEETVEKNTYEETEEYTDEEIVEATEYAKEETAEEETTEEEYVTEDYNEDTSRFDFFR